MNGICVYGSFCWLVVRGKWYALHCTLHNARTHNSIKYAFFPYAQAKSNRWQFIKHFVAHFFLSFYFRRVNHKDDLIILFSFRSILEG